MSDSDRGLQDAAREPTAPAGVSWPELGFFLVVLIGGFLFLRDAPFWGHAAYVGSAQFGDAEFWWNGALHFSQGIVAENPNLTFRMGYAAFGGTLAAVCGPDYRIFHQLLLVIFLLTSCGLYAALRRAGGRVAAAATVLLLVFNPFTAEWLAISTSDALGLVLNLVALLALTAGVRRKLELRWIAVFGIFMACASLTRPLMTPFMAPAALAVLAAGWGAWRKTAAALMVMFGAFILPTLAWMAFMGATTGNFALTGASQDSSAFYAASDPQIQCWRPDMYAPIKEAARKRYGVEQPTAQQINAEFWAKTAENYRTHWRYHAARLWSNAFELARFTPQRGGTSSALSAQWRANLKGALTLALAGLALWRRRWISAGAVAALGVSWILWPQIHPWLVLTAGIGGLAALVFGRRGPFVWTAYWWVGVMALYLTGGTWGPPLGATQDLNALGYRLGFQFFFAADLMIIGLMGCIAGAETRTGPESSAFSPSALAGRIARGSLLVLLGLLALLLAGGAAVVTSRLVARARSTPTAYPDLGTLGSLEAIRGSAPFTAITPLRVAVNAHQGLPLLTKAMSSGFVWNLPGQQRSMLLLYQQDYVRPVHMSPRQFYVEIPQQLPAADWMNRQGAWVIRSFPNTAQNSNLPYYFEMPAVQAFIPLAPDGKSFAVAQTVRFPLAKSATQLVASGELVINGGTPAWAMNSGAQKFPRRFALQAVKADEALELLLDLSRARGKKTFRFGVMLESTGDEVARAVPVHLRLTASDPADPTTLWESDLAPGGTPLPVNPVLPEAKRLRLSALHVLPTDTLWFYELVMTADDFTQ